MTHKKTTQQYIADELGVSRTTVSRALRMIPGPNRETSAKIIQMARSLGYQPPSTEGARKRKQKATRGKNTVLVVVGESGEPYSQTDGLQTAFINGSLAAASEMNLNIEIEVLNREVRDGCVRTGRLPKHFRQRKLVGAVLAGRIEQEFLDLVHTRIPVVRIGSPRKGADTIGQDNIAASQLLVNYLIGEKNQKIGFIGSRNFRSYNFDRSAGYVKAMLEHTLQLEMHWIFNVGEHNSVDEGLLLDRIKTMGITACVCAHDGIAYRLLQGNGKKRNWKKHCTLVGFDDLSLSGSKMKIPSIRWPISNMAEAGLKALLNRIEHPTHACSTRVFEGTLVT